jgi:hypothetical protein
VLQLRAETRLGSGFFAPDSPLAGFSSHPRMDIARGCVFGACPRACARLAANTREFGIRRAGARGLPNYIFYCYLRVSARTGTAFLSACRAQIFEGEVHGRVGLRVA